ncbi:MAG: NAD(+) diphosphatase [Candidatus Limiplasma sp.]|nr:NAD(+) diphosphatase [Candidatus Limiplasma sp.]
MLRASQSFSVQPSPRAHQPSDLLLCFRDNEVLLPHVPQEALFLPAIGALLPLMPPALGKRAALLCRDGENALYALDLEEEWTPAEGSGFAFQPIDCFRRLPREEDSFWLITAYHLVVWARRSRFCGNCGQPLSPLPLERALGCGSCGQVVYPTISPAVSVAITQGDRLLMARNARSAFRHFSLIAGYVEAGESLEDTVHREVMEEVGLRVKNLRYVGSQPWGVSQSLMLGFHGELEGGDEITLQESELSEARWFHRSEIEPNPNPLSLSFAMIESFRAGTLP